MKMRIDYENVPGTVISTVSYLHKERIGSLYSDPGINPVLLLNTPVPSNEVFFRLIKIDEPVRICFHLFNNEPYLTIISFMVAPSGRF